MKPRMHSRLSFQGIGIAVISGGALFPAARAGTVTYLGPGTLSNTASWDTAARPVTTDEALFINALPDPVTTAAGTNLEFGNFLWNSNSSSTIALNSTGTTSTQLRLTNGGGSSAAIANGGNANDLLLLGTAASSNTVIISGNLNTGTADIDGILEIEYDGTAGGLVDLLQVTGLLDITNASINFSQLGATADDTYVFATYGSLTGGFAPERITGLPTSFPYFIDYNYLGANQIALVIPEPAAALITALGLLPLLRRRR